VIGILRVGKEVVMWEGDQKRSVCEAAASLCSSGERVLLNTSPMIDNSTLGEGRLGSWQVSMVFGLGGALSISPGRVKNSSGHITRPLGHIHLPRI
jgi:hypothetical protein